MTAVTSSTSEQVAALLAPYLGPFNARMWVKAAARRDLGLSPEELKTSHLAALADGLRPSLEALMGRAAADDLLQQILHEVR